MMATRIGAGVPADSIRADVAPEQPRGGRPFYPVVMMIKCLLLAKWYGLSDPQLEEQLRDRLSFRRFVGLGLTDSTPDETTFVNFRKRLRDSGRGTPGATLFDGVLGRLRRRGLVLAEGSLVDATIVEQATGVPRKQETRGGEAGESTRDRGASFTKKHGREAETVAGTGFGLRGLWGVARGERRRNAMRPGCAPGPW